MPDNFAKNNLHLVRGRLLARNVVWNLLGTGSPLIVAIPVVPILIRSIGTDRFGVLTLAWAFTGYTSLFDLGLGRALTQIVAQKLGEGEDHEVPKVFWTSLLLMLLFGFVGMAAIVALSSWLAHHALKIPLALQDETTHAFRLLGLSVPIVITSTGLRGLLEAHQRFDLVSTLRVPIGVFTFAGPLLVLPFTRSLGAVVGVLVAGRLISCAAHLWLCFRVVPELRRRVAWHRPSAGPLLRFGGWLTVGNIVGPMMMYLDRFIIAAMLSATAVAYYATPYDMVTKLLLIPTAVVAVMFPAFSVSFVKDRSRTNLLYSYSVKYILLVLFPIILLLVVLAQNGLTLWLGADFARHSTRVVQWLALGAFANSLAFVPFSFIQGIGKPDLTTKLHLFELPFYLVLLFWLIHTFGIEGAALAWSTRTIFDASALFLIARRFLPTGSPMTRETKGLIVAALALLLLAAFPQDFMLKAAFLFLCILGFVLVTWFLILTPEERSVAQGFLVMNK
jgi:O-antigen/teichoic acid export membrane protein